MHIRVENVTKVFQSQLGTETTALDNVSLDVASGEIACIIGPSGCGKSTLLNTVAGFEQPTEGNVLADDRPITKPGVDRVVIFQDIQGSLMPWLTALENVEFGLRLNKVPKEERRKRGTEALELVGLAEARDKYVTELSGGMQQRVQLARALTLDPQALLMDEPFGALDFMTRSTLQAQFQQLHEQRPITTLFVTHDLSEAALLGDVVWIFAPNGRIEERVPVELPRPRTHVDPGVIEVVEKLTESIDFTAHRG